MNANEFNALCVSPHMNLREAMERMDSTARGILLVVDSEGHLMRTLTDGDLRRAILGGFRENSFIGTLPSIEPISAGESAGSAMISELMDSHKIDHIPVVNADGIAVDIILRKELYQRIWLSSPHLGNEEEAFVAEAFRSNWIAPLGPHVDSFEKEVAAYVGIANATAVNSGTAAIHLALVLMGVKSGDTVFCSSLTFVGSCNPIVYCGARPVFIDSEPETWNMSPAALKHAFEWAKSENCLPRCVIIVNLYGQSADMDRLIPICEHYGVTILEDAAESFGARYKNRSSGTFGMIGVYSFNGNKIITTSGGGMLVSEDGELMRRARKLATQAREPVLHYEHSETGFNYRMSNVLAGIGRGQLKVLDERVAQRRRVFEVYRDAMDDLSCIKWMPEPSGYYSTRWLSCFTLIGEDAVRQYGALMKSFDRHSIDARPIWKPMQLQPLFRENKYFKHAPSVDVSAAVFGSGICLPSGSNLTDSELDRVIDCTRRELVA